MSQELNQQQLKKVLQGISIPPQPQIMVDLQLEQVLPDCSLANIAKLISQDIGLSGSIIKTVNSPFFTLANTVTSIEQAVNLLGVNSVVSIVNAHSIRSALSDDDIIAMGRFWDNAMEIAQAATAIAKQIGSPLASEAYTLGLFHNAGIPLLMSRVDNYPEILKQAYADKQRSITDAENALIHTNHAVVGYYVSKSWKLPKYICEAIHQHHNVLKVLEDERAPAPKKTLLAILKMAEHTCATHRALGDQSTDHEWEQIEETVLMYCGLSEYDFSCLKESIAELGLGNTDYYS